MFYEASHLGHSLCQVPQSRIHSMQDSNDLLQRWLQWKFHTLQKVTLDTAKQHVFAATSFAEMTWQNQFIRRSQWSVSRQDALLHAPLIHDSSCKSNGQKARNDDRLGSDHMSLCHRPPWRQSSPRCWELCSEGCLARSPAWRHRKHHPERCGKVPWDSLVVEVEHESTISYVIEYLQ